MGLTCSKSSSAIAYDTPNSGDKAGSGNGSSGDVPDPIMYDFMKRSVYSTQFLKHQQEIPSSTATTIGQKHLLYKQQQQQQQVKKNTTVTHYPEPGSSPSFQQQQQNQQSSFSTTTTVIEANHPVEEGIEIKKKDETKNPYYPTKLMIRRHTVRSTEEGITGTHIYAIRWSQALLEYEQSQQHQQEQYPTSQQQQQSSSTQKQWVSNTTTHHPSQSRIASTTTGNPREDRPVLLAPSSSSSSSCAPTTTTTTTNNTTTAMGTSSQPTTTTTTTATTTTTTTLLVHNHHHPKNKTIITEKNDPPPLQVMSVDHLFLPSTMAVPPKQKVLDWVTVSEEHDIYVADVGLSREECDRIVAVTEHVCRGQYAAYTYAKQTLGCREFPMLAIAVQDAVHTITHAIMEHNRVKYNNNNNNNNQKDDNPNNTYHEKKPPKLNLALDDREPHMVKYDVTRKERQKLDMHTDKSEWTFLISLSNGCGMDYTGGGTYFECLDSTVHIQRGHALVFPGKLRHCGQRITHGLRFLLVGFLVDKPPTVAAVPITTHTTTTKSSPSAVASSTTGKATAAAVVVERDEPGSSSGNKSPK